MHRILSLSFFAEICSWLADHRSLAVDDLLLRQKRTILLMFEEKIERATSITHRSPLLPCNASSLPSSALVRITVLLIFDYQPCLSPMEARLALLATIKTFVCVRPVPFPVRQALIDVRVVHLEFTSGFSISIGSFYQNHSEDSVTNQSKTFVALCKMSTTDVSNARARSLKSFPQLRLVIEGILNDMLYTLYLGGRDMFIIFLTWIQGLMEIGEVCRKVAALDVPRRFL